jgi:flagellar basal-body rod modification protein FlgD
MSSSIGDLSQLYSTGALSGLQMSTSSSSSTSLDMTDFLQLMVTQLTSQTIDDTADTSDMLNQLVQMQMIEAITNITDATMTMYAGSLVGKEVTIAQYTSDGQLQQTVGVVTGTGQANGEQIVFIGDQSYYLSEITAIGRLPSADSSASASVSQSGTVQTQGVTETVEQTEPDSELEAVG